MSWITRVVLLFAFVLLSAGHAAAAGTSDINGDRKVDIYDYNLLIGAFGITGTGIAADIDGNGVVDIFDYNRLVGDFGTIITVPSPSPSPTPSPVATNTYYVAKNNPGGCNDTWPGTESQPRCTIQAGTSLLTSPGSLLLVKEGTYASFTIQGKAGAAGKYLTVAPYGTDRVIVSGGASTIALRNSSYIKITGLEVTGATDSYGAGIRLTQGTHHSVIEKNKVYKNNASGVNGIFVEDGSYNEVLYNDVTESSTSGIWIVAHDVLVTGNVVKGNKSYRNTGDPGNADGIAVSGANAQNNILTENIVYENGDDGIDTWSSNHQIITKNISYGNGLGGDGNGYKMGGTNTGGSNTVIQNVAYNNKRAGFDSNHSGNNTYINNVAYGNGFVGFQDGEGKYDPCTVETCKTTYINNIAYNNAGRNFHASDFTAVSHNNIFYMDNGTPNLAYNGTVYSTLAAFHAASGNRLDNPTAGGLSSYVANPRFTAPASGDFTLLLGSPAINAGDSTNPGKVQANGVPDIGIHEFGL